MISYNTTNYRRETKSNTVVGSVVGACLIFFKTKENFTYTVDVSAHSLNLKCL